MGSVVPPEQGTAASLAQAPPEPELTESQQREIAFLTNIVERMTARGAGDDEIANYFTHYEKVRPGILNVLNAPPDPDLQEDINNPGLIRGVGMEALQGLSFGFGDEAIGAIEGIISGKGVQAGIDAYRQELEAFRETDGTKALIANLGGSFLSGGGILALGRRVFGRGAGTALGILERAAGPGAGTAAKLAVATGSGAAAGAVQAVGSSDIVNATGIEGDVSDTARTGAITGGLFSLALVGGGKAIGTIARPAIRKITTFSRGLQQRLPGIGTPEMQARELVLRAAQADGLTRTELLRRAAQARAQGKPSTLADIGGENLRGLMEATQRVRGPAKQKLVDALTERQGESGDRLVADLMTAVFRGTRPGLRNSYHLEDLVMTRAREAARPLYNEVYERTVELTPRMRQILTSDTDAGRLVRRAYNLGRAIADGDDLAEIGHGLKVPTLDDVLAGRVRADGTLIGSGQGALVGAVGAPPAARIPIRAIDMMKRALDDMADPTSKEGISKEGAQILRSLLTGQKGIGRDRANGIITIASEMVPEYRQARAIFQHGSEIREAIDLGRRFQNIPTNLMPRVVGDLPTEHARQGFRVGALEALAEEVNKNRGQTINFAQRFFGGNLSKSTNAKIDRIRALLPEGSQADDLIERIHREARMTDTFARSGRGSLNQPFTELLEETVGGGGLPLRGGIGATVRGGGVSLFGRVVARGRSGWTEDVSDAVSDLFLRGLRDPAELEGMLSGLRSRTLQTATTARLLTGITAGQAAGATIGQTN